MTPIEIAAKAHWHRGDHVKGFIAWEALLPETRAADIEDMRAALLALADAELPEGAVKTIADEIGGSRVTSIEDDIKTGFRAMLRSLAGSDASPPISGDRNTHPNGKRELEP